MTETTSVLEGAVRRFRSEGTAGAGNVMIETGDISRYDVFTFLSWAGSFTVEVSTDGTQWSNAVSLQDFGATSITLVTTGTNGPFYQIRLKTRFLRVKQSGGTALTMDLLCGNMIGS